MSNNEKRKPSHYSGIRFVSYDYISISHECDNKKNIVKPSAYILVRKLNRGVSKSEKNNSSC